MIATLVADYIEAWNEPDAGQRRARVARLWTVDGRHRTRIHDIAGHDAIADRIATAHQVNVAERGHRFVARGNAQQLDAVLKFNWDMVRADGSIAASGLDVMTLDDHDRIVLDIQFIEP